MAAIGYLIQTRQDLPPPLTDWLTAREQQKLAGLVVPKRRSDWILGRWTAKRALAARLHLHDNPGRLEILAAPDGAPEACLDGMPAEVAISLSHSGDRAICAVADAGTQLGCDLEQIEKRSDGFIETFFTASEQALCKRDSAIRPGLLATLIWSAKESALKAIRQGLRLDTRTVEVHPDLTADRTWRRVDVRYAGSHQVLRGWWTQDQDFIVSIVAAPQTAIPVRLTEVPELDINRVNG